MLSIFVVDHKRLNTVKKIYLYFFSAESLEDFLYFAWSGIILEEWNVKSVHATKYIVIVQVDNIEPF